MDRRRDFIPEVLSNKWSRMSKWDPRCQRYRLCLKLGPSAHYDSFDCLIKSNLVNFIHVLFTLYIHYQLH